MRESAHASERERKRKIEIERDREKTHLVGLVLLTGFLRRGLARHDVLSVAHVKHLLRLGVGVRVLCVGFRDSRFQCRFLGGDVGFWILDSGLHIVHVLG